MVSKIGSAIATIATAMCLAACSAAETSDGQAPAESAGSGSSDAAMAVELDAAEVVTLVSAPVAPSWYIKGVESSTPGEFTAGNCSNDLYYYPIRKQGDPKDAYGYYASAVVEGIGEGILLTMVGEYATNGIEPYGLIVWVSETTQKVFSTEQVAEFYFIPDAELGDDPEIAKYLAPEIGLCADQNLS